MVLFNLAGRSDAGSLFVKCEDCDKKRNLEGAFAEYALSGENGYRCTCNHPHLPEKHIPGEECSLPMKIRLRSSTGIYYPVSYSAL